MKEPPRFLLFFPIFSQFFLIFSLFFPDFWQIFRCQGGTSSPPPWPPVAMPLNQKVSPWNDTLCRGLWSLVSLHPLTLKSLVISLPLKLNSYSNTKHFFIAFLHVHFRFWGHEHLTNRSISKYYPKSHAAPWLKNVYFKSVSHLWQMILLIIWKCSAQAFYHWSQGFFTKLLVGGLASRDNFQSPSGLRVRWGGEQLASGPSQMRGTLKNCSLRPKMPLQRN